jgi:hypothetical protein
MPRDTRCAADRVIGRSKWLGHAAIVERTRSCCFKKASTAIYFPVAIATEKIPILRQAGYLQGPHLLQHFLFLQNLQIQKHRSSG